MSCELRFLELRGVISGVTWSRLDAPETVAGGSAVIPPPAARAETQPPSVSAPPEKRPGPAAVTPPPSPTAQPRRHRVRRHLRRHPVPAVAPDAEAQLRDLIQQHVARAGGWTPQVRLQVEAEAKQLGLAPEQVAAAMASPVPAPISEPRPAPPVPGAQEPTLPAKPSPAESFRRWVKQKLASYPSAVLATDDEQGLVGVGAHRYRLADVLATHIVRDIVTEREMRLERDLQDASCHSTVGGASQASSDDQKLTEFFEQVAPILSQHRGINAQSRVMMNAVAEQLGMTEEELNRAIKALALVGSLPG